jgi:hypothetical protein
VATPLVTPAPTAIARGKRLKLADNVELLNEVDSAATPFTEADEDDSFNVFGDVMAMFEDVQDQPYAE